MNVSGLATNAFSPSKIACKCRLISSLSRILCFCITNLLLFGWLDRIVAGSFM